MRQTVEQTRAKAAWEAVESVDGGIGGEYLSVAQKAPAMVMSNGLGPSAAFLRAKTPASKALYAHVSGWLVAQKQMWEQPRTDLIAGLVQESSDNYRLLTVEALAYLTWLKRFAEAKFKDQKARTQHAAP